MPVCCPGINRFGTEAIPILPEHLNSFIYSIDYQRETTKIESRPPQSGEWDYHSTSYRL